MDDAPRHDDDAGQGDAARAFEDLRAEMSVLRKRCSEALRLQFAAAGFQHQGMSSSIWAWGQPLTRRVSRSVK